MIHLYARATKGQGAYSKRPLKRGKNISIIGAMTLKKGFLSGLSFDGGTNEDIFLWFIEDLIYRISLLLIMINIRNTSVKFKVVDSILM